jgi:hypothetical protein
VELAPEFPVLDGDSGKTAGVVIFLLTAREPDPSTILSAPEASSSPSQFFVAALQTARRPSSSKSFLHLKHAARRASRARWRISGCRAFKLDKQLRTGCQEKWLRPIKSPTSVSTSFSASFYPGFL